MAELLLWLLWGCGRLGHTGGGGILLGFLPTTDPFQFKKPRVFLPAMEKLNANPTVYAAGVVRKVRTCCNSVSPMGADVPRFVLVSAMHALQHQQRPSGCCRMK